MKTLYLFLILFSIGFTHVPPAKMAAQTPNTKVIKVIKYDQFGGASGTFNLTRTLADSIEGLNAYIHDSITMAIDTAQVRALHKSRAGWGIVKDSTPTSITFNADPALLMPRAEAEPVIDSYGSMINARVKYTDTPAMLAPYVKRWLADLLYQPILGYTPENAANKVTNFSSPNNTTFPTSAAVNGLVSNYYPASNPSNYISGINSSMVNAALGYTPYNGTTNPNGYLTSVPAQTWSSITGKPTTLSGYGITDAYPLSGNPSSFATTSQLATATASLVPTARTLTINGVTQDLSANRTFSVTTMSGTVTSVGLASTDLSVSGSPVTTSGNMTANLNTTGVSAGTYGSSTAIPVITVDTKGRATAITTASVAPISKSWNYPTRSLSTTGSNNTFTISATKDANVSYSIKQSVSLVLTTSSSIVSLDYSTNGGSSWQTVCSIELSYLLSVTISSAQRQILAGDIPAGALVRIYNSTNTNTTTTIQSSQEVY